MTLYPLFAKHEPSDACGFDHCYSCNIDEPVPQGSRAYLVCVECGHVYWRARDLRRLHRRSVKQGVRDARLFATDFELSWWGWLRVYLRRARRIWSCPLCGHDF